MKITKKVFLALIVICLLSAGSSSVFAVPIFFGPTGPGTDVAIDTSYLSTADIPVGFYGGGSPAFLEDFEDSSLDGGITASLSAVTFPGIYTDSVDADDGLIDGLGTAGHSWHYDPGSIGVTFTFSGTLPTAAALVWTDGYGTTTFEAFGAGMVSLGTIGPVTINDGMTWTGTTGEDRFFGVQDLSGILAIKVSNTLNAIEIDHVQYGSATNPVPEPSTIALLGIGLAGLVGGYLRRRRQILVGTNQRQMGEAG